MSSLFHKSFFFRKCDQDYLLLTEEKRIYPQKFPPRRSHSTLALLISILLYDYSHMLLPANLLSEVFPVIFHTYTHRMDTHVPVSSKHTPLCFCGTRRTPIVSHFLVLLPHFCFSIYTSLSTSVC